MSTENEYKENITKALSQDAVSSSVGFAKWIGENMCRDNWFKYDNKVGRWYVYLKGHLTTEELYELYLTTDPNYVDSETILQSNNIGKASFLSATPFLLAICKNNNLLFTNARHLSIAIRILKESATIN